MSDIELVIKIPEEVKQAFDNAKYEDLYGNYYDYNSLIGKAIRTGLVLPSNHGRLIDADELWDNVPDISSTFENHFRTYDFLRFIENTPTIIEKRGSEE